MSSPAKKRKLNNGTNTKSSSSNSLPSRGLEYFFAKQKQSRTDTNVPSGSGGGGGDGTGAVGDGAIPAQQELTDEELARKLQAEWDREAADAEAEERRRAETTASSAVFQNSHTDGRHDVGSHSPQKPLQDLISGETSTNGKEKGKGKGTLSLQSTTTSTDTLTESIPLDESPLTFDPAQYIPQLKQHWASEGEGDGMGGGATYALLTRCFVLVSGTTSRIKIVDTLVNCLRLLIEGDPDSLLPAVSQSRPVPMKPATLRPPLLSDHDLD